jgi:hypothetical protein
VSFAKEKSVRDGGRAGTGGELCMGGATPGAGGAAGAAAVGASAVSPA